jgi:hypothetical protein
MEETKKPANVILADKSESKSMLHMMNVVIAARDKKRD